MRSTLAIGFASGLWLRASARPALAQRADEPVGANLTVVWEKSGLLDDTRIAPAVGPPRRSVSQHPRWTIRCSTGLAMLDPRRTIRQLATSAAGTYAAYVAHGLRHPALLRASAGLDARAPLPGDDLVPDPHWVTTFAIAIHAPREAVWPWLVQIGYGRAGWYTWYRWDNGGVPSAERIVPELQHLAVGDVIPDGLRAGERYGVWRVHALDRPRAMVLFSRRDLMTGREIAEDDRSGEKFIACSWAFVLEPTAERACKLVVRVRARLERFEHAPLLARGAHLLFGVGDTVMERTLLDGIKERAERAHANGGGHA